MIEHSKDLKSTLYENTNPFTRPAVTIPRLYLEDLLVMLRKRLNKGYMPSATGEVEYNSKPEYLETDYGRLKVTNAWGYPDTNHAAYFGTLAFGCSNDKRIFAYIGASEIEILVNLSTDEALVRHEKNDKWIWWPSKEKGGLGIAINTYELQECIDTYL